MLARLLAALWGTHSLVRKDADDLLMFLGGMAYSEARTRARERRKENDWRGDRHWTRVAVEIARRTGIRVGEKVADRYAAEPDGPRRRPVPRSTADGLVDIANAILLLATGQDDATTLHNACARERASSRRAARHQPQSLSRSCARL